MAEAATAFWNEQKALCARWGAEFHYTPFASMIGINRTFQRTVFPLNGLRHPQTRTTSGWYIWSGEYSAADDFFVPLHAAHLLDQSPEIIPYLGLAPGRRFLLAPQYEDVWFDSTLLHV